MLPGSVNFATLPAADLERAKARYRDKFGFEPIDEDPGGRGAWFTDGEGNIRMLSQQVG